MKYLKTALIIFLCFSLTSAGYLAWLDRLLLFVSEDMADILTMDVAYLLQAAGILLFSLLVRRIPRLAGKEFASSMVLLFTALVIPSVTASNTVFLIVSGLAMNLVCGIIAASYLYMLVSDVERGRRGIVWGAGYAAASLCSWLYTVIMGDKSYQPEVILITCVIFAVLAVAVLFMQAKGGTSDKTVIIPNGGTVSVKTIILAAAIVVLINLTDSTGFAFPASDMSGGLSLEAVRLMYAAGLIIAGLVNDRNRKFGAFITVAALIIPFVILALQGVNSSAYVFWCLSYLAAGFFAIYRITLFADIATESGLLYTGVFGLMFGRVGEALGSAVNHVVNGNTLVLIILTVVMYMAIILLFYKLYQMFYNPEAEAVRHEQARLYQFARQYDLSTREVEILRLLSSGGTTADLAGKLFISESTVKFHIHNLIQKTGTKNRSELVNLFMASR